MTRKDYELIAKAINRQYHWFLINPSNSATNGIEHVIYQLIENLQEDNPRFRRDIFLKACGIAND